MSGGIGRWLRGTFGLVALVAFGFAPATLAIGVVAFESTHEALEQQLDNRLDEALASDDRMVQRDAIEAASAEARDLLDIFAALLRIAEVERMDARPHFREVLLSALVAELAETYRPAMEASGHVLETAIAPNVTIDGDRRLLQRLLTNLLDNAIIHTPRGTRVTVALTQVGDAVRLCLADDGPGVSPQEAASLFQRFTRADRSRSTGGHGLRLSLIQAVAVARGGVATVQPESGLVSSSN